MPFHVSLRGDSNKKWWDRDKKEAKKTVNESAQSIIWIALHLFNMTMMMMMMEIERAPGKRTM